ncbi:cupredoxin domain-containing protein [Blastococcus sp. CCUG 61487]|jgi:plastocyanin|uniref:Cupredoxin-like domain-containing protein n=1 Tax=Blastococcus aggregatus TaxID=38502 RepID=A0A285V7C4_9ACTN|nr:cupredoxin domain-containing protein [Blastococcus sp. CCUG 61487]SOC50025.1 Cupredoxin-like domain-containing protein [Blastococcus aggregatus]
MAELIVSRRTVLLTGLAGVGAMALSACGSDPDESSDDAPADVAVDGTVSIAPDGTQEVTVLVRDDYDFYPAAFTVTTGRVRLSLISEAKELTHNFRFTPGVGPAEIAEEIPILAPGESDTMEFPVDQLGDYQFECSFHVALGQIGTMTVTSA